MLTIDFINVGCGDAVLIRETATPFAMLVDCGDVTVGRPGPGSSRVTAAEFLQREGVRRLDLLVLTHLHLDHSGGLRALLREVEVREFWTNYLPEEAFWGSRVLVPRGLSAGGRCLLASINLYLAALETMGCQGTRIHLAERSGERFALARDLTADVFLEEKPLHRRQEAIWAHVLAGEISGAELDELDRFINNTSIRLRLRYAEQSVELPGDVYAACWEKHLLTPCALVKLPHHGHRDAVTPHLLEMLRPKHTVISVSDDRPDDCPSASAIRAVLDSGSRLHFTDAVDAPGVPPVRREAVRFHILSDGGCGVLTAGEPLRTGAVAASLEE